MKILFFTPFFYPHIGGVETHVLELCKILGKEHEITVVTELYDKNHSLHEVIDGIEIYRIPVGKEGSLKKFEIWRWMLAHKELIQQANIVHAHDVFFWYLPFRFLYPFKKVFITFHGYETVFPPAKKAITVRKISEKLSKGTIVVGDYIKKWYGARPDFVTYGGTDKVQSSKLKVKSLPKENKTLKIAFIGRLEKDTGVDLYLETLKKLKQKKISYNIDFFGDGSRRVQCEKYGKVHGFVKNTQEYLQKADVVFASSYLSILDAFVLSKIVIAVFDNQLKEDYLKMSPFAHYIFIANNADDIVKIIETVRKDPWKTKSMIANGSSFARKQTWEQVSDLYLQLWKK